MILTVLISVHRPINDTEEKAVMRLALTYGVLRRIGFLEDRVMDCLNAISGYDLDEAYDWVRILLSTLLYGVFMAPI